MRSTRTQIPIKPPALVPIGGLPSEWSFVGSIFLLKKTWSSFGLENP